MKMGTILAVVVAFAVSGCGLNCGGAATENAAGGACGLHTTFFASRAAPQQASAFRKS
jgi:hypothetical protein